MLRKIDNTLRKAFGLPYLRVTRDQSIFDRCEYFLRAVRDVEGECLRVLDVGCGSGAVLYYVS